MNPKYDKKKPNKLKEISAQHHFFYFLERGEKAKGNPTDMSK